ncbi:MAG: HEAT repeat domain-containing protein [Nanoarchaeota archaeon]|nr:HEAT repeat domain-containing protein [Nanoarchaeota archaeon]
MSRKAEVLKANIRDFPSLSIRTAEREFLSDFIPKQANFPKVTVLPDALRIGDNFDKVGSAIDKPPFIKKNTMPIYSSQEDLGIIYEPIISIEPLGNLHVYDIEVEGTHNFVAEGIVAHNTVIRDKDKGLRIKHEESIEVQSGEGEGRSEKGEEEVVYPERSRRASSAVESSKGKGIFRRKILPAILIAATLLNPTFGLTAEMLKKHQELSPIEKIISLFKQDFSKKVREKAEEAVEVEVNNKHDDRGESLRELIEFGQEAISALLEILEREKQNILVYEAALDVLMTSYPHIKKNKEGISKNHEERMAPIFLKALAHQDSYIRQKAVEILGEFGFGDEKCINALIERITDIDEQDRVRIAAITAFCKIGPLASREVILKTVIPVLINTPLFEFSFSPQGLKESAMEALDKINFKNDKTVKNQLKRPKTFKEYALDMADICIKGLADVDEAIRTAAIMGLSKMCLSKEYDKAFAEKVLPALTEILKADSNSVSMTYAVEALSRLGENAKEALPILLVKGFDEERDLSFRKNVADAIWGIERMPPIKEQHIKEALIQLFKLKEGEIKELTSLITHLSYYAGEACNDGFSVKDMLTVYFNSQFRLTTEKIGAAGQFSIARAVAFTLKRFELPVNNEKIEVLLPFILKTRSQREEKTIWEEKSSLTIICHEEKAFNPKIIKEMAQKRSGITDVQIYKGKREKENILKKIETLPFNPSNNVFWFHGHGGTKHLWLGEGEPGKEESNQEHDPRAISSRELADALIARAKKLEGKYQGELSDMVFIVDACHSADSIEKTFNFFIQALKNKEIKSLPTIVTGTNRGGVGYFFNVDTTYLSSFKTSFFQAAVDNALKEEEKFTVGTLYKADEKMKKQNIAFFFPLSQSEIEELRTILKRLGVKSDEAERGFFIIGKTLPGKGSLLHPYLPILGQVEERKDKIASSVVTAKPNELDELNKLGKCLTPNSLIHLADGTKKPLIELKEGDMVLSLNQDSGLRIKDSMGSIQDSGFSVQDLGKLEPHRVNALLDMGVKPVYKITTKSGKQLKTTLNHPYLTKNGWRKLKDIKVGEEIAVVESNFRSGGGSNSGSSLSRPGSDSVFFNNKEFPFKAEFIKFLKKVKSIFNNFRFGHIFDVDDYYARGVSYIKPQDIPEVFIEGKQNVIVGQGVIKENIIRGPPQISIKDTSQIKPIVPKGANDISVNTLVGKNGHNDRLDLRNCLGGLFHKLRGIFNSSNSIFLGNIRILLGDFFQWVSHGNKIKDVAYGDTSSFNAGFAKSNFWVNSYSSFVHHYISTSYLKNTIKQTSRQANLGITYEPIISIEPLGNLHVYDIEVEGTHNFVAEGIVAHNTYAEKLQSYKGTEEQSKRGEGGEKDKGLRKKGEEEKEKREKVQSDRDAEVQSGKKKSASSAVENLSRNKTDRVPIVLCVDDRFAYRMFMTGEIQKILGSKVKVLTADSKDNAWRVIKENFVDMIVSDLSMGNDTIKTPVLQTNGAQLIKEVKEKFPKMPIIVLSATMGRASEEEKRQLGADVNLDKEIPDELNRVGRVVEEALKKTKKAKISSFSTPGGIDLNPKNLDMEIRGQGLNIPKMNIPFDIQNFQGFTFNIIKIEVIEDLNSVLNIPKEEHKEKEKHLSPTGPWPVG